MFLAEFRVYCIQNVALHYINKTVLFLRIYIILITSLKLEFQYRNYINAECDKKSWKKKKKKGSFNTF